MEKDRVHIQAYADDVVLMAESEKGMRFMLSIFQECVREKDFYVDVEKTKVNRFRKKKGKVEWRKSERSE